MKYELWTEDEGIFRLADLTIERNLIPVFGAGFTYNCRSNDDVVPDGFTTTEIMKKILLDNCDEISLTDLKDLDFNKTAKYFLNQISYSKRSEFFLKYFSKVTIDGFKKEFIDINWPYAYTLNVDDGIENSSDFTAILPYNNLEVPKTTIKLLYKIHGDAFTEATSKDSDKNIVFSSEQYIISLMSEDNIGLLNNIETDYSGSNLLFIGCSLKNEPDLKFIYNKVKMESKSNYKIILRSEEPKTFEEKMDLNDYGINVVLLVSNYDLFYQKFIKVVREKLAKQDALEFKYINPNIKRITGKDETIRLISGSNIFDAEKNVFLKSGMYLYRNAIKQIRDLIDKNSCVIIKGRRFSGKTHILCSICEEQKKYKNYFFPSNSLYDEELIYDLLNKCNNSLFLFDSNSVSTATYMMIANSDYLLNRNNNKIIIVSNSNDNFIIDMLHAGFYEIQNSLENNELIRNNNNADRYALTRRRKRDTNLDYLHRIAKEQKILIPLLKSNSSELTENEQKLLLLLVVHDKVFLGDAMNLGIYQREISDFIRKFPELVELVQTDPYEKAYHSAQKIVHNGKALLIDKLNKLSREEILNCILTTVKVFRKDKLRYRLYIELILFDTLNQLFGGRKGAGHLIYYIYQSLENELNGDLHYWLQRAKSIYRLRGKEPDLLKIAYSYAKKVYLDGYGKLVYQSALSLALICCKLAGTEINKTEKIAILEEMVIYAHSSIFSSFYSSNNKYLKNELQVRRKNSALSLLRESCSEYVTKAQNGAEIERAKQIIFKLDNLAELGDK